MKFYNRKSELELFNKIYNQTAKYGRFTVLTGRRRVGKTMFAREFCKDKNNLYFFISKKSEKLLCAEFLEQYKEFTGKKVIGKIEYFTEIFELLLQYSVTNRFVLIIDEFQEFQATNSSLFSEIQKLWDQYKFESRIHLIFIGSIYSLMIKIFQNKKEPLFGRADRILAIKPFKPGTIKTILQDNNAYSNQSLFYNYLITGGIPRYLEILSDAGCFDPDKILDFIFSKDSPFLEEGKYLLIEEFGKEYGFYFTILELIASGKTARSEIESILEKSIGGYLDKLEHDYSIITKIKPFSAKKTGRIQKYQIKDNFIRFWFRFIYKYYSLVENENFEYLKKIVKRDLSTYSGHVLEELFRTLISSGGEFSVVGNYWEKGNKNEIDIVAIDDLNKRIKFYEVKLNPKRIDLAILKAKSEKLLKRYNNYQAEYKGLSLDDLDHYL